MYHVKTVLTVHQTYGVQTFKVRNLPAKFKHIFVMFHEMYLSYHGQILLKFGTLEEHVILKILC